MRKSILSNLTLLVIAASLAWAGEGVWKTKPYQQWDQKDIQQVLEDSPWVKVKTVTTTWRTGGTNSPRAESGGGGRDKLASLGPPSGACDSASRGGACDEDPHAAMGASSRPVGEASSVETSQGSRVGSGTTAFLIRWNSSQTIRKALARNALLNKRMTEADASNFVGQSLLDFEILFSGNDMSPFARLSEEDLKSDSYLEANQSKQKAYPTRVAIKRAPSNGRVILILFSFPRQTVEGQSFIGREDKDVEFACKLKNLDLRVSFDLHKMTIGKEPDL